MIGMSSMRLGSLALLALAAGSAPCFAGGSLAVGGFSGQLFIGRPVAGGPEFVGTACTAVQALTIDGGHLWFYGNFGLIVRYTPGQGFDTSLSTTISDGTALAVHNGDLLVGTAGGKVHRVDAATGAIKSTRSIPMGDIRAMMVEGNTLYTGGQSTFVYKSDATAGSFSFLTACGGKIDSMTIKGPELILGTVVGTVYRIDKGTGAYYATFPLPAGETALAVDGADLLVGSADGTIRRVNPTTGAVLSSFVVTTDIRAMAMLDVACKPDVNGDGRLDISDFIAFQNKFALGDKSVDFTGDGKLDIQDFTAMQTVFATGCPG